MVDDVHVSVFCFCNQINLPLVYVMNHKEMGTHLPKLSQTSSSTAVRCGLNSDPVIHPKVALCEVDVSEVGESLTLDHHGLQTPIIFFSTLLTHPRVLGKRMSSMPLGSLSRKDTPLFP